MFHSARAKDGLAAQAYKANYQAVMKQVRCACLPASSTAECSCAPALHAYYACLYSLAYTYLQP